MPAGANQPATTIPLQESIRKLSKYFGLYTVRDLAGSIALSQIQGQDTGSSFELPPPPEWITKMIEVLIDTSTGGYTSQDIVDNINRLLLEGGGAQNIQNVIESLNKSVKVVFGPGDGAGNRGAGEGSGVIKGSPNRAEDSVQAILGSTTINSDRSHPNRDISPSLSAIMVNNVRVLPIHRNVNAVTIFMNALPSIEISRCVPFLEVVFQFSRPPTDADGRIQAPGLIKFIDGAEVANGTRRILLDSSVVKGTNSVGRQQEYTAVGMEVFTAPQTFVNADEDKSQSAHGSDRRSVPIQDKFRPMMTFKSLTVEIVPTTGFMCFKTAKMDFVLHDKSRLAEVADFIRPDLYGNTEILIEYGWSHPDPPSANNMYANLLNGMRCKEKYGIINTSMQFDEAGQAVISLSLAMRGANDFRTETISSDETGVSDIIRQVRNLTEQVGELRRRVFQSNSIGTREVRGVQVLDAASDSNGQLLLTPELRTELANFRAALRNTQNPSARALLGALNNLYGADGRRGQTTQLRSTIQANIARKLARLSRGGVEACRDAVVRGISVDRARACHGWQRIAVGHAQRQRADGCRGLFSEDGIQAGSQSCCVPSVGLVRVVAKAAAARGQIGQPSKPSAARNTACVKLAKAASAHTHSRTSRQNQIATSAAARCRVNARIQNQCAGTGIGCADVL